MDEEEVKIIIARNMCKIKTRCPNADTNQHLKNGQTDSIFTEMVVKVLDENGVCTLERFGKFKKY